MTLESLRGPFSVRPLKSKLSDVISCFGKTLMSLAEVVHVSSRRFPLGHAVVSIPPPLLCVAAAMGVGGVVVVKSAPEREGAWFISADHGSLLPLISNRFRSSKRSIPCVTAQGQRHRSFHIDRKESFGSVAGERIFPFLPSPSPFTCPSVERNMGAQGPNWYT